MRRVVSGGCRGGGTIVASARQRVAETAPDRIRDPGGAASGCLQNIPNFIDELRIRSNFFFLLITVGATSI